jgi:hypothetical protein
MDIGWERDTEGKERGIERRIEGRVKGRIEGRIEAKKKVQTTCRYTKSRKDFTDCHILYAVASFD